MCIMKSMRIVVLLLVFVSVSAVSGYAAGTIAENKISQNIKIQLDDVTIAEALEKISKEIDFPIRISDEAEWKLPYGNTTRLSVTLDGPASEALTQMLNEFFMRYAIGQDMIVIYPRPELDHIIGRPSTRQLSVLKIAYTTPIMYYTTDDVSETINTAINDRLFLSPVDIHEQLNHTLRKLCGEKRTQVGEYDAAPVYEELLPLNERTGEESEVYELPTAITLAQLLRDVEINGDLAGWYIPSIDFPNQVPEIRVVDSRTLYELSQAQLIDVTLEGPALEMLQKLADRGNIEYYREPDVNADMGDYFSVSMQNVTAMQAMKKIADIANLGFESRSGNDAFFRVLRKNKEPEPPTRAQTRTTAGAASTTAPARSAESSQYVGKISIPMEGGKYFIEYMLRESDLPEELKQLRAEKIAEILGQEPSEQAPPKPKPAVPEQ